MIPGTIYHYFCQLIDTTSIDEFSEISAIDKEKILKILARETSNDVIFEITAGDYPMPRRLFHRILKIDAQNKKQLEKTKALAINYFWENISYRLKKIFRDAKSTYFDEQNEEPEYLEHLIADNKERAADINSILKN